MSINKTFLTYTGVLLFFFIVILFTSITQTDKLADLIWTIVGVFITFMTFDSIFVKLFKVSESRAVFFSFALVFLFFIIIAISSPSPNAISQLIIQIIISILFLIIFNQFVKKDEQEKIRLLNLPADSNINLSELSIISNKSERKLRYLISKDVLSTSQSDGEIHFNKAKALNELKIVNKM